MQIRACRHHDVGSADEILADVQPLLAGTDKAPGRESAARSDVKRTISGFELGERRNDVAPSQPQIRADLHLSAEADLGAELPPALGGHKDARHKKLSQQAPERIAVRLGTRFDDGRICHGAGSGFGGG